jgi:hypothetical protein
MRCDVGPSEPVVSAQSREGVHTLVFGPPNDGSRVNSEEVGDFLRCQDTIMAVGHERMDSLRV